MTHRHHSKSPLLLLLTLTALAGCERPPPPDVYVEVLFEVTVPPETPLAANLFLEGEALEDTSGQSPELIYQGGNLFAARADVPKGKEFTYRVRLVHAGQQLVELDAAGTVVAERKSTVQGEETVPFTVERWGPETGLSEPQLVIAVKVPENTPSNASIWLAGNHEQLGNWNPVGLKLHKAVDGHHATYLSFAPGTSLEYKVTRGSWETVEKDAEGRELDGNRTLTTGTGFERVLLTVGTWADLGGVPPEPTVTGNVEYLEVTPTDTTLPARTVIVWLPPGYDPENSDTRYPVLYMHDGQNLMDEATSFVGEWKVDETAKQLIEAGEVEPLIIVGVYHAESERAPEYTQVPDARFPKVKGEQGGRADAYGLFLVNELKPLIDGKYHTKPEARNTGLAGSSLGGLVSMYLGMKHPGTFTRLGVLSPSVFWGDNDILTRVDALPEKLPLRIWLDIGTAESDDSQETVDDTRALRDALVGEGWVLDTDLKYTEVQGGKHNEAAWAARFGDVLQYLFPAQ